MTRENIEKLEECEDKLNDVVNQIDSILLAEQKYKEWLCSCGINSFEHNIKRSEHICSLLYRSVYIIDGVMNDLIRFTEDGIIP